MSTTRETMENSYVASTFAERGLFTEAGDFLLKQKNNQNMHRAETFKQIEKRPRPILHAK